MPHIERDQQILIEYHYLGYADLDPLGLQDSDNGSGSESKDLNLNLNIWT